MDDISKKALYDNSIYWVEVERIKPNPYQPRKEFDEMALASLAESIRQYGVLQPLTVTRKETEIPGEGIRVEYELTSLGQTLREPLTALGLWAERHIEQVLDARDAYDRRSPEPLG